jgi:hypothetical protein
MKKLFLFHLKATKEKEDNFKVPVLIITKDDKFEIMCFYVPLCSCDYLMHITCYICLSMHIVTHVILSLWIWLCFEIDIFFIFISMKVIFQVFWQVSNLTCFGFNVCRIWTMIISLNVEYGFPWFQRPLYSKGVWE